MPLHFASRMHALIHGLFHSTDEAETRTLYDEVAGLLAHHKLASDLERDDFFDELAADVVIALGLGVESSQIVPITHLVTRTLVYEDLFVLPDFDWSRRHSTTEYWQLREELNRQRIHLENFDTGRDLLQRFYVALLSSLYKKAPMLIAAPSSDDDITLAIDLLHGVERLPSAVEEMLSVSFAENSRTLHYFSALRTA